jgi:hypothetical protein
VYRAGGIDLFENLDIVHIRLLVVRDSTDHAQDSRLLLRQCTHLTESVYKFVLKQLTPTKIRQLIPYPYQYKEKVDGFWWESTSAKRLCEHFL